MRTPYPTQAQPRDRTARTDWRTTLSTDTCSLRTRSALQRRMPVIASRRVRASWSFWNSSWGIGCLFSFRTVRFLNSTDGADRDINGLGDLAVRFPFALQPDDIGVALFLRLGPRLSCKRLGPSSRTPQQRSHGLTVGRINQSVPTCNFIRPCDNPYRLVAIRAWHWPNSESQQCITTRAVDDLNVYSVRHRSTLCACQRCRTHIGQPQRLGLGIAKCNDRREAYAINEQAQ